MRVLMLRPRTSLGLAGSSRVKGSPRPSFYQSYVKRPLDLAVTIPLLVLLGMPMIVIAVAIRRNSPGPAIFRQLRIGKDGRPFTVLKFRTMTTVAGPTFQLFPCHDGKVRHKLPDDPRVTSLGRVLRRTSLDELPQLINVLRGDMSLVGPRPELPEIVEQYEPWQHRRHEAQPGITGWWQVHGRGQGLMFERTDLDLYYVDNVSFRLDLSILLKTFLAVRTGHGAY